VAVPTSTTLPVAATAPVQARAVPAIEVKEGADLVSFSNLRWKDDTQKQLAVEIRLLKGALRHIRYDLYGGDDFLAAGFIAGTLFSAPGATQTSDLPPVTGVRTGGESIIADVSKATRLVVYVVALPENTVPSGQPSWVAPRVAACEQGSAADCKALAAAYRTGQSEEGSVEENADLAQRFSKRFVSVSEMSCALGSPAVCFALGLAYEQGEDAPQKHERGIALIQKACAGGDQAACDWQVANPEAIIGDPPTAE
jgi:hypothetical protein